jgi:DNA-binding MarR family transcriptional regulator
LANKKKAKAKQNPAPVITGPADMFTAWVLLDYTRFVISRLRDVEVAEVGLTPERAAILNILNKYGSSTVTDIADAWMRQHHSVSTLINRMAAQGLIQKIKHPKQKEIEICITPKGKALQDKVTRRSIEMVFSTLTPDDVQKLSQYLKLLFIRARGLLGINKIPPILL